MSCCVVLLSEEGFKHYSASEQRTFYLCCHETLYDG